MLDAAKFEERSRKAVSNHRDTEGTERLLGFSPPESPSANANITGGDLG
jgi:hypothetical protein